MFFKRIVSCFLRMTAGLALATSSQAEDLVESIPAAADRAQIAIIIDDLGYSMPPATAILELPHPITLAIIPFTPYGKRIAEQARAIEKEVMLHAPMETLSTTKWEKGLTVSMDEIELFATMDAMLGDIPYVVGVNNHGGSKLTQDSDRMNWIMSFLAQRELYFIDSRTIAASVAADAAKNNAISYNKRDVFIDNEKTSENIEGQINKLVEIALENGKAIGIGHPYRETTEALAKMLPEIQGSGIRIVNASALTQSPERSAKLAHQDR